MAFDLQQFMKDLREQAGLSEDEAKALQPILQKESVAKFVGDGFMRQSDYSRKQDEMRKEVEAAKAAAADEQAKWTKYGGDLKTWEAKAQAAIAAEERYKELYGDLPADGQPVNRAPAFDASKYVSREDHERAMQQSNAAFLNVVEDLAVIQGEHAARFGTPLRRDDVTSLKEFALKHQMRLGDAYERWIAPRVEEVRNKEFEAKLAEAREEGRKSALSEHKLPVDVRPSEPSPFWDWPAAAAQAGADGKPPAPPTPSQLQEGFVNAYHEAAKAGT